MISQDQRYSQFPIVLSADPKDKAIIEEECKELGVKEIFERPIGRKVLSSITLKDHRGDDQTYQKEGSVSRRRNKLRICIHKDEECIKMINS